MPTLSADFGIILAYMIPGFLCLWAASWTFEKLKGLFHVAREGEKRVFELFALIVMALVVGMLVSIVRAVTIDKSFEWTVPLCSLSDYPQCGSVTREDPEIAALSCEQSREALLFIESRDKRPYQFYGNMVLAASFIAAAALVRERSNSPKLQWQRVIIGTLLWAVGAVTFYSGSRLSHYRFMDAVDSLNAVNCVGQSTE